MTTIQLEKLVKKLPHRSGIYIFKDSINKPLYIGKALDLKNRVKNYLKTDDVRLQKMVATAKKLYYVQTNSDIEALILESQLIKKFRPRFNIVMRDDKQYFYVGFTNEVFPKIFLTHQPWASGACPSSPRTGSVLLDLHATGVPTRATPRLTVHNFIGPFTDGSALKATLSFLRSIFPYCTCTQLHNNFCLNYHIGKCLGFCCLKKHLWITDFASRLSTEPQGSTLKKSQGRTLNSYKKNITSIKMVLSGKKKSVIRNLEKEMVALGKKMEKFVPILFSTESKLQNRGSSISGKIEDFDEIGKKAIELRGKLKKLKRIFENAKIIQKSSHTHISIYGYGKHNNKKTENNLIKILALPKMPVRIEGYDVSNIQGTHATGSMVTFVNGQPDKNYYRKFKIKNLKFKITGGNDIAMLKEILERRFKHPEWPYPDLILIDGGKGQVNAARAAITNYQGSTLNLQKGRTLRTQKISIIGISKNKHHIGHQLIIPGRKIPLALTKLSPADKNLLLRIDSEAHRLAIGYYRKLHRENLKATF